MKKSLNRQITVYFLIILFVMVAVSAAWNYYSTRQSILDMEKSQAEGCVETVSNMLKHYGTAALKGDRTAEEYTYIHGAIRNFCMGFGQDALYLYTPDAQAKSRKVLLAVASNEDLDRAIKQGQDIELLDDV